MIARWLQKLQPALWIAVGILVANVIWLFMARFAAQPLPVRRKPKVDVYTGYDTPGPGVKILQFYSSKAEVIEGDHTIICYGVAKASAVRIEPPIEQLRPALNRCIEARPEQTTTYTLYAEGVEGSRDSISFTVKVLPAPARIKMVFLSDKEVIRGEPVTVCTILEHALSARIEPINRPLMAERGTACSKWYPAQTMDYRLVAKGVGGNDSEKFRIIVKPRERKGAAPAVKKTATVQ